MEYEELDHAVTRALERHHVPGAAIGLLDEGDVHTAGFGVTSVEHPLDVTDETLFQIGSITKTFTATAIVRLAAEGTLDLDAPLRSYLPDFRVRDEHAAAHASLRHVLTHTAGWVGDLFLDTGAGDTALADYVTAMADLEQLAPLGLHYSYNNAGFTLAGHVVAIVTDRSFVEALEDLVLDPLGLERIFFDPGDVITHRFAVGHRVAGDAPVVARPWPLPRAVYPAGGIICDVPTLMRYAQFHLGDGTVEDGRRIAPQEMLQQMQSPQAPIWGDERSIGLGWHLEEIQGLRIVDHGGGTTGQISTLMLVPEHGFAFALVTNADRGARAIDDVRGWLLKERFGIEREEPEPIEAVEEELRPFVGRYVRPFAEIEIGLLAGKLVGQVTYRQGFPDQETPPPPDPPPASLSLCAEDCLVVGDGPLKGNQVHVIRRPDGSIGWLRMGRLYKRV
jgi:CubicO group peptidase (beta-lactamase class C family)